MGSEPIRDAATLPVRQEIDGAAMLEVADDCSIALALQPGEVVNADHANIGSRQCHAPPQEAQQRVGADRHGEASSEPFSGTAAEGEGDRMGEHVEARGASSVSLDEILRNRSVKIRRSHEAFRHQKRRATKRILSRRPCAGKSPRVLP